MGFHFQPVAVHSKGCQDPVLSIHGKTTLDDVNDLTIVGIATALAASSARATSTSSTTSLVIPCYTAAVMEKYAPRPS